MITRNRFLARSALLAMLPYVMVMLTCAFSEASHLPLLGPQGRQAAAVTSQTPSADGDEELCGFTHEQLLTKQAFSARSIATMPKVSHVGLIGEARLRQITDLDRFRPPGPWFTLTEKVTSPLYSVLRI